MRLNTLLLIAGLLALGFGLGFLMVPGIVLPYTASIPHRRPC